MNPGSETSKYAFTEKSLEIQGCIFPNLGIVRNVKPTDVSWYSIPGKA
jgi:hypothetical protein